MSKFEELVAKLSELFELDKADLDFGIHRIIKSKHKQITEYLTKQLPKKVKQVLGELAVAEAAGNLTELKKAILDNLAADAIAEDGALAEAYANTKLGKQYLVALESSKNAGTAEQTEAEVYSHLFEFFSRYYEDGDFLSLRRRTAGRESYSIPYDGEEVTLHWANKDQYYIKSSEDMKDYTFAIPLNPSGDKGRVHFKLTRMDAIQNNNKATRIFQLDEEAEIEATDDGLVIPFRFAEGKKRTKTAQTEWEQSVLAALPTDWQARLAASDTTYTGEDQRTILQKHLRNYTKKNTSDYFIHKDLGGFLRRELDFYIKNEVMYLDDVDSRPADYLEKELRKIKAIRAVSHDLIDFLAQFEDFQKKLWLKKKFVNNLELEDRSANLLGIPGDVAEEYLLRYLLDVETRESLLNLQRFEDPLNCTLKIYNRASGEAEPTVIDLPETFNYLLGLRVRTMRMRDGFLVIEGENPAGETVLVIWRNVKDKDNTALEKFVTGDLGINPTDTEYAAIYINGDTTLDDPHKKILLIEQVFHELMFDVRGL